MPDPKFSDPRLARIYDPLDPDRRDLDAYVAMVDEFAATSVLDIGCGTGTFACLLAGRGIAVTGVDPAAASLEVARGKKFADRVRWICGDATALPMPTGRLPARSGPAFFVRPSLRACDAHSPSSPVLQVDLAFMTGNVAQVFLTDDDWLTTLRAAHDACRPGGRLIFESRIPERRTWEEWTPERTRSTTDIAATGPVTSWTELVEVSGDLVSFRSHHVFTGGQDLTSNSTLRFRSREQIENSLAAAGFTVDEVRDAPDRPGREYVFVARR